MAEALGYWIKLYERVLISPTMGTLPDHLWRRAIELFLLAGRNRGGGALPPIKDVAWVLRITETRLSENLEALSLAGITHEKDGIWYISNFNKYQKSESNERVKRFREKHKEEGVTRYSNALDKDKDKEEDVTKTKTSPPTTPTSTPPTTTSSPHRIISTFIANMLHVDELTPSPASWGKAVDTLVQAGVTTEDIRNGYEEIRDKNYTIVGAQSIVNPAIAAKVKRLGSNGHQKESFISAEELNRERGIS